MSELRPELPRPVPERIAALPVYRGYPVPWFVAWLDEDGETELPRGEGTPEFRITAARAITDAYVRQLCWICGQQRQQHASFVAGSMCAVNRTSAEPPSHPSCAGWAACACPFLVRPHMVRREAGLPEDATFHPAHIARNPGVAVAWSSSNWQRFLVPPDRGGGILFNMGDPEEVVWFAHGRLATRNEVIDSIESGLPALTDMAAQQGEVAQIVAAAAHRWMDRGGGPVWTYSHAWRVVKRSSWGRVSVLASCETPADVGEARARGYATSVVVHEFPTHSRYTDLDVGVPDGDFLPCPAQTKHVTCSDCRLCFDDEKLRRSGYSIAFEVHGSDLKKKQAHMTDPARDLFVFAAGRWWRVKPCGCCVERVT